MKLFPPQAEVHLYEEGFGDNDLLQRKGVGKRLSDLLENVDDPVVLAVDGAWGSGKSHFLKRWVGAHTVENGGRATTVYFDAFANDFIEDPLISLTGFIGERLPSAKQRVSWKKAKNVVVKVARPLLRVGAALATAGASELTGPVIDAAIEAGGKEAEEAVDAFWRREDGRRAAMQQFRNALAEITKDGSVLIIVVDELDRCRPDYALATLEVIKHFFAVERVHFVLGVNMEALEHIVRVRYGAGVNAPDYIKRFISLSIQLPMYVGEGAVLRAQMKYFRTAADEMGIDARVGKIALEHLELAIAHTEVTLRDIEKILTRLVVLPRSKELGDFPFGYQTVIIALVIWQVLKPDFHRRAFRQTLTMEEIDDFFGISSSMLERESQSYNHDAYLLSGIWRFALTEKSMVETDRADFARTFDRSGRGVSKLLEVVERDFFSVFEVRD